MVVSRERFEPVGLPTPAAPLRLRHVDSLRAVAALAVVWTHFADSLLRVSTRGVPLLHFLFKLPPFLNLGRIGVLVFFAISGFVICRSFTGPRAGSTRRFLIRRACRLYPAFWASMFGGALVWWLLHQRLTPSLLAANATMLPASFGQPDLIGVYWTLEIEWLFYAICLGLHLVNGLGSVKVFGGLALACAILPRTVHKAGLLLGYHHVALSDVAINWMISLALMFWGAAFRLVYDETGGFRRRPFACPGTWFLALLIPAVADLFNPNLKRLWLDGQTGTLLHDGGFILAMLIFALWMAVLRIEVRPLTYLGLISYSLYLFHPVVMDLVLHGIELAQGGGWLDPRPLWVTMTVCAALTVALGTLTYRWVERPAIAFGKRWAAREQSSLSSGGSIAAD